MQSGNERLLQANQEIPWQKLSTMGMAGQLQIKAGIGRSRRAARLMCQKQPEGCVGRGVSQCDPRVAAWEAMKKDREVTSGRRAMRTARPQPS
jgi:hypothetical protein